MQDSLRIETAEHAVAAVARLKELERRFCAAADPLLRAPLAREIIRVRTALNEYALRHQIREAHDARVTG
jgi:hypothetical protein